MWLPLEAGGVAVGVVASVLDASKEGFMVDCGYDSACNEVSVVILEKVGGGPGGEAAWMADAMLRPVVGKLGPLRRNSKCANGTSKRVLSTWSRLSRKWD